MRNSFEPNEPLAYARVKIYYHEKQVIKTIFLAIQRSTHESYGKVPKDFNHMSQTTIVGKILKDPIHLNII